MSYPTVEQDLAAACRVCERTITQIVKVDAPTSTDWVNVRAARHLARRALERYDNSLTNRNRPGVKEEVRDGKR